MINRGILTAQRNAGNRGVANRYYRQQTPGFKIWHCAILVMAVAAMASSYGYSMRPSDVHQTVLTTPPCHVIKDGAAAAHQKNQFLEPILAANIPASALRRQ